MGKNISIEEISEIIYSGKKIAVVTGAGVSVASGITPFRDENGNYLIEGGEYSLSIECLSDKPEKFYEAYKRNILKPNSGPNITHTTLAQLQEKGYIEGVITQNIDGLHNAAGSRDVIELHGDGTSFYCTNPDCKERYGKEQYQESNICPKCGNMLRPDIVLYGECANKVEDAFRKLIQSDVVIVLGASLKVSDINSLLSAYMRYKWYNNQEYGFIIINKSSTWLDNCSSVCREDLSEVFERIQRYGIENGYLESTTLSSDEKKLVKE